MSLLLNRKSMFEITMAIKKSLEGGVRFKFQQICTIEKSWAKIFTQYCVYIELSINSHVIESLDKYVKNFETIAISPPVC